MNNNVKIINNKGMSNEQFKAIRDAFILIAQLIDVRTCNSSAQIHDRELIEEIFNIKSC